MAKKMIFLVLVVMLIFAVAVPSYAYVGKDSAVVAALEKVWLVNDNTVAEVTDGKGTDFWEVTVINNGVTYVFSVTTNGTTLVNFTLPEKNTIANFMDRLNVYALELYNQFMRLFSAGFINSEVALYEAAKAAN